MYLSSLVLPEAWRVVSFAYRHISCKGKVARPLQIALYLTVIPIEAQREGKAALWHASYASIIVASHGPLEMTTGKHLSLEADLLLKGMCSTHVQMLEMRESLPASHSAIEF